MKRYIAILLALAFLCAALSACSGGASSEDAHADSSQPAASDAAQPNDLDPAVYAEQENPLTQRVLSDWFDYLLANEYLYGDMLWALSYVEAFQNDRTWENLQMARMALWTAERYITEREKPEETVTAAEYDQLIRDGKDVSFVQPEIGGFAENKSTTIRTCALIRGGIESDVFWEYTLSAAMTSAELAAQRYQCELGYLAATTDYLIFTLGESETTKRFDAFVQENCPRISALRVDGGDEETLYRTAGAYLDELEALIGEEDSNISQYQACLDLYRDAILTNSFDTLLENPVEIENLPALLPEPNWGDADVENSFYYWNAGNGSHIYPEEGQEFDKPADGFSAKIQDVTREAFLAYHDLLENSGYSREDFQDEGDALGASYSLGDAAVSFLWSDGAAIISMEGNACFAPIWYITVLSAAGNH